jgi:hypothetical protein
MIQEMKTNMMSPMSSKILWIIIMRARIKIRFVEVILIREPAECEIKQEKSNRLITKRIKKRIKKAQKIWMDIKTIMGRVVKYKIIALFSDIKKVIIIIIFVI